MQLTPVPNDVSGRQLLEQKILSNNGFWPAPSEQLYYDRFPHYLSPEWFIELHVDTEGNRMIV